MVSALLTNDIVSKRKKELEQIQKTEFSPEPKLKIDTSFTTNDNLFNGADTTAQISFSETKQPNVSSPLTANVQDLHNTNLFDSGTVYPNKDIYNQAKETGGTVWNTQLQAVSNAADAIGKVIGLGAREFSNNVSNTFGGIFGGIGNFGKNVGASFQGVAADTAETIMIYAGNQERADRINAQFMEKYGNKIEKEGGLENLAQGDIEGFMGNLGYQVGYMLPTILASFIPGGKVAKALYQMVPLFSPMFMEAYNRYSQIEGLSDTEVIMASTIAGLLNAGIETLGGLNEMLGINWSGKLLQKIEKPLLRYAAQLGINTAGESIEEILQAGVLDLIGALMGEDNRGKTFSDFLKGYLYQGAEGGLTSFALGAGPTKIMTDFQLKQERYEKFMKEAEGREAKDRYITDAAKNAKTLEEFKKDIEPFNISDNKADEIWKEANMGTEEGINKVFGSDEEYQSYLEDKEKTESEREYMKAKQNEIDNKLAELSRQVEEGQKDIDTVVQEIATNELFNDVNQETNVNQTNLTQSNQTSNKFDETKLPKKAFEEYRRMRKPTGTDSKGKPIGMYIGYKDGKYQKPELWSHIAQNPSKILGISTSFSRRDLQNELKNKLKDLKPLQDRILKYQTVKNFVPYLGGLSYDEAEKYLREYKYNSNSLGGIDDDIIDEYLNIRKKGISASYINQYLEAIIADNTDYLANTESRIKDIADKIWRDSVDSPDNKVLDFANFVLKRANLKKNKELPIQDIKKALEDFQDLSKLDLGKIFEGAKLILLDHGGTRKTGAYGSTAMFVDGEGIPVLPVDFNFIGQQDPNGKLTTIIHELVHAIDNLWMYRHGFFYPVINRSSYLGLWGTTGLRGALDFQSMISYMFKDEYMELVNNMDDIVSIRKDGKVTIPVSKVSNADYYYRPTEVFARCLQQYFSEKIYGKHRTDGAYWKDNDMVNRIAEKFLSEVRDEFGLSISFDSKIDSIIKQFEDITPIDFFEAIQKVGDKIKELNERIPTLEGRDKELAELDLADYSVQRDMLMEEGIEYVQVANEHAEEMKEIETETKDRMDDVLFMNLYKAISDTENKYKDAYKELLSIENELFNDAVREAAAEELRKRAEVDANIKKEELKDGIRDTALTIKNVFMPVYTRLENISQSIAGRMAMMEGKTMIDIAKYNAQIKPFLDKYMELSDEDKFVLHRVLMDVGMRDDVDIDTQRRLFSEETERLGLSKEINVVLKMFDLIKEEFRAAGLRLSPREIYFPREVRDYKGLVNYVNKKVDEKIAKIKADEKLSEKEKDKQIKDLEGKKLSGKELIDKINKINNSDLSEVNKSAKIRQLMSKVDQYISYKTNEQKKRTISTTDEWGLDILAYYETPEIAIMHYVEHMVERLHRAEFFGMGVGVGGLEEIRKELESNGIVADDRMMEAVRNYIATGVGLKSVLKEMEVDKDTIDNIVEFIDDIYELYTDGDITKLIVYL